MKWKANDELEIEIDVFDMEFQKKYIEALEKFGIEEKAMLKEVKIYDITESYCNAYYSFFDNILGKGTGDKIFKGKKSAMLAEQIFEDFILFVVTSGEELKKRREQMQQKINKYMPVSNQKVNNKQYYKKRR